MPANTYPARQAVAFAKGQWVVNLRYPNRGRIGMVYYVNSGQPFIEPSYVVQYGQSGPFKRYRQSSLRAATPQEIRHQEGR